MEFPSATLIGMDGKPLPDGPGPLEVVMYVSGEPEPVKCVFVPEPGETCEFTVGDGCEAPVIVEAPTRWPSPAMRTVYVRKDELAKARALFGLEKADG